MSKIIIGIHNKKNIHLDLDVLIRTRLLIQSNSGGGKSWLLRRIIEQSFGKIQIIIIDPEGEFSTLREKLDFVLVGKGGETPADVRSAALVAHKLLELNASAIIDLYEMKASLRHEYVKILLDALLDSPKNLWHPVMVIVDEAHIYAPEKGSGESVASDAMIGLATRGRKRGFFPVFATQRLGKLRKDAAAELTNVLIGQTFIDVDRKRAAETLGIPRSEERAFFDEMKIIEPGNFYALGRAISKERILVKIGDVQTTHPEPGSSYSSEPPPAPAKIKSLLPKLSDLPQEAEQKARTETELRKENTELKRQLSQRPTIQVPEIKTERIEIPAFQNKELERLEQAAQTISNAGAQMSTFARDLFTTIKDVQNQMRRNVMPIPARIQAQKTMVRPAISSGMARNLPPGETKILTACGQYPDGVAREELTVLTGYKRSSRDAYIQRLAEKGYVKPNGRTVLITDEGMSALGSDFIPLPTGSELLQYWMDRLKGGERKLLEILTEQGRPIQVDREYLTERTNYQRSSRDAYLQRMNAKRLIENVGKGQVIASSALFD